jgi:hypothetical protein
MPEAWVLFLSIFLGIPAGGIAGALSLKFIESINNYMMQKNIIKDIRNELEINSYNLNSLKKIVNKIKIDNGTSFYNDMFNLVKGNVIVKKDYYKIHMHNLFLLKSINAQRMLLKVYGFENFFNSCETAYNLNLTVISINEKTLEFLNKMESRIAEEKESGRDVKNLALFVEKMKNKNLENRKILKRDKINELLEILDGGINEALDAIKDADKELKKIYNKKIIKYWFLRY